MIYDQREEKYEGQMLHETQPAPHRGAQATAKLKDLPTVSILNEVTNEFDERLAALSEVVEHLAHKFGPALHPYSIEEKPEDGCAVRESSPLTLWISTKSKEVSEITKRLNNLIKRCDF